jgi:hydrogenase nickel incorporation protein HypA/HybF
MHEVGIAQNLLESAEISARKSGGTQIHCLRLRVGAMSGVVPEALQFAFEVVRQGTMANEAILEIEAIPAVCWCEPCQKEFTIDEVGYVCPLCNAQSLKLRRGRELELVSLDIS